MNNRLLVFDLDDTLLMGVTHLYARPMAEVAFLIIEVLGVRAPNFVTLINKQQEIDRKRLKTINPITGNVFGFSRARFPGSQVETYRYFCKAAGAETDAAVEEQLFTIGLQAFDGQQYASLIHSSALEILQFLREQNHILVLCTKGDPVVQNDKIDALERLGVADLFHHTFIVNDKTDEVFTKIYADVSSVSAVSIGNIYHADIAPALAAGYRGVLIPATTWEKSREDMLEEVDGDRCVVLDDLSELKTCYEEWV